MQSNLQLQRFFDEDERRRRLLGGGGGGFKKFEPYVPFSFLTMNRNIDLARIALANFFNNNFAVPQINISQLLDLPVFRQINQGLNLLRNVLSNSLNNFSKLFQDTGKLTKAFLQNISNLVTMAASALFSMKFLKYILGKDEDQILEHKEIDEVDQSFNLIERFQNFFSRKNSEHQDNKQSLFAHLENIANQLTKLFLR